MSTEPNAPDPRVVREILRKHLVIDAATISITPANLADAVRMHFGDALTGDEFHAWCLALRDSLAAATTSVGVSWPDEQPQDERDGDVRAVAAYLAASSEDAAPVDPHPRTVLRKHFADRIAALEARDAMAGDER